MYLGKTAFTLEHPELVNGVDLGTMYRYENNFTPYSWNGTFEKFSEPILCELPIKKRTAKGVWILVYDNLKFVQTDFKNSEHSIYQFYAQETKEAALTAFIGRKRIEISRAEHKIEVAKGFLQSAKDLEKLLKELTQVEIR